MARPDLSGAGAPAPLLVARYVPGLNGIAAAVLAAIAFAFLILAAILLRATTGAGPDPVPTLAMSAALVGLAAAGFLALAWLLWRQGRARGPALLIRPAGLEIICQNALGGLRPPQHLGWDQIEAVAARHVARGGRWFRIEPSLEAAVALGLLPPDYRHDGVLFAVRPVLQVPLDRLDHDAAALVGALAGPLAAAGLRLEKSCRFRGLWDEDRWTLVRT